MVFPIFLDKPTMQPTVLRGHRESSEPVLAPSSGAASLAVGLSKCGATLLVCCPVRGDPEKLGVPIYGSISNVLEYL
jgi:hypothetical protein